MTSARDAVRLPPMATKPAPAKRHAIEVGILIDALRVPEQSVRRVSAASIPSRPPRKTPFHRRPKFRLLDMLVKPLTQPGTANWS